MIINCIDDIVKGKGLETPDQLHHYVYKYTDRGAWIEWGKATVRVGSIVEGSDAEFMEVFFFPFDSDELDAWINELEQLCDEAWHEANDELEDDE